MTIGTKSILFGVHQFILHPFFVLWAWLIIYRETPRLYELCAIITHDWGYWGCPNMDGEEGEEHPDKSARLWDFLSLSELRIKIKFEIAGHSRFNASRHGISLSKLFRADKLAMALYPIWLYLLLGNLTGEIHEYMNCARDKSGKYSGVPRNTKTQMEWFLEARSHMTFMGLHGEDYAPVAKQMKTRRKEERCRIE